MQKEILPTVEKANQLLTEVTSQGLLEEYILMHEGDFGDDRPVYLTRVTPDIEVNVSIEGEYMSSIYNTSYAGEKPTLLRVLGRTGWYPANHFITGVIQLNSPSVVFDSGYCGSYICYTDEQLNQARDNFREARRQVALKGSPKLENLKKWLLSSFNEDEYYEFDQFKFDFSFTRSLRMWRQFENDFLNNLTDEVVADICYALVFFTKVERIRFIEEIERTLEQKNLMFVQRDGLSQFGYTSKAIKQITYAATPRLALDAALWGGYALAKLGDEEFFRLTSEDVIRSNKNEVLDARDAIGIRTPPTVESLKDLRLLMRGARKAMQLLPPLNNYRDNPGIRF